VVGQLNAAIERSTSRSVLVDLEDCEFIDSTAIAALVLAHRNGHRILAHSPAAQARRVLAITGLYQSGLVFESRSEALSQLG
jgi:anti-anti-sigma factor